MKELRNEHHHVTFLNVDRLHQWSPANHDRERRGLPGLPHIINYTCRYSIATAAFTCDFVGCDHLASGLDVPPIKVITIEQAYVVTTIQA